MDAGLDVIRGARTPAPGLTAPASHEQSTPIAGCDPPRWLVVAAFVAAGAVLTFGAAGLFLAVLGAYRAPLAFAFGALLFVGLLALVVPALPRPSAPTRTATLAAALGVAAIAAITVWNGANASQHVVINRDPGAYMVAGRWIARDGSLEVRPVVGAFRGDQQLVFNDLWVAGARPPRYQFQGAHLLPSVLAEAYAVGGDRGMFALPALLGGVALLEFFVLAWRLLRQPAFALAATGALAFILPEVAFARDAYTEVVAQVLLLGALALLVDRRVVPHWRLSLGAGLLLGAIQATRIDAALLFIAVPMLTTVAWLRAAGDDERRRVVVSNRALVAGLVPGFLLGIFDLTARSASYWDSLWRNERKLLLATVGVAVVCLAVAKLWPRLSPAVSKLRWDVISSAVAIVVVVGALTAWFVRPIVLPLHQESLIALQRGGQLTARFVTLKFEGSMWWMSWYVGPLTLVAAIVAAGCLTRALLRGRRLYALAPLALFVPESLVYLWYANAYTDHVWVARRFLTSTFPLLILLALGLAALLWRAPLPGKWSTPSRVAAVVIAVGAVAFPVWTIVPVRSMRDQGGYEKTVTQACKVLGPNAAVVVLEGPTLASDTREDWIPQTLRSWCGVPVGVLYLTTGTHDDLLRLATRWQQLHRKLFVVATGAAPIRQVAPEAVLTSVDTAVNRRLLTQTFTHRPAKYETESLSLVLGALQPAG